MERTDTHYHIDQASDPAGVLNSCREDQLRLIAPSLNPSSYHQISALQERFSEIVSVGLGLHPETPYDRNQLEQALELSANADLIGEVGLPCYERSCTRDDEEVFRAFCQTAAQYDKTMIVHAVHSQARPALEILARAGVRRAVFHWLKAEDSTVEDIISAGYFVSVTPEVTYRHRDQHLLRLIPRTQLLIETDGPYPHGGPYEGKETQPHWIDDVANHIATAWNCTVADVWRQHEETVHRCFFEAKS